MKTIKLYHGGNIDQVADVLSWGLKSGQEFCCTRNRALAEVAQHSHGVEGQMLEISVPGEVFTKCLEHGYLVEREYVGCIPVDYCTEVVVGNDIGMAVINELLQNTGAIPFLRKEKVIGRLFK